MKTFWNFIAQLGAIFLFTVLAALALSPYLLGTNDSMAAETIPTTDQDRHVATLIQVECGQHRMNCANGFIRYADGRVGRIMPTTNVVGRLTWNDVNIDIFLSRYLMDGLNRSAARIHTDNITEAALRHISEERWLELGRVWFSQLDTIEGDHEIVAGYCMGGENRCAGSYAMTTSGLMYRIVENGSGDPSTRTVDQVWFATLMNTGPEGQRAFESQWAAIADPGDSDYEIFEEAWCFQAGEDC